VNNLPNPLSTAGRKRKREEIKTRILITAILITILFFLTAGSKTNTIQRTVLNAARNSGASFRFNCLLPLPQKP